MDPKQGFTENIPLKSHKILSRLRGCDGVLDEDEKENHILILIWMIIGVNLGSPIQR